MLAVDFARAWILFVRFVLINNCATYSENKWKVWRNVSGQTTAIRNHLKDEHETVWREVVLLEKLKGWKEIGNHPSHSSSDPETRRNERFSIEGFYERLLRWIAVDDQV
jgi:hypothetical protein